MIHATFPFWCGECWCILLIWKYHLSFPRTFPLQMPFPASGAFICYVIIGRGGGHGKGDKGSINAAHTRNTGTHSEVPELEFQELQVRGGQTVKLTQSQVIKQVTGSANPVTVGYYKTKYCHASWSKLSLSLSLN